MSWELASFLILGAVLVAGFAWYERSRPPSQVVALVAALAALAIAGRVAFAAFPNVKPTTDIVILAGYALGGAPGFAVGALTAPRLQLLARAGPLDAVADGGLGPLRRLRRRSLSFPARRIDRFTLAAACGLAGVAYGALLNFSLMATYGGDLSVQRFTALESRAIPFDLAHAIGNVVFALVAGPAMLRMLVRFRARFEWRARDAGAGRDDAGRAAARRLLPGQAKAATGSAGAADWLVSVQNSDGGWGSSAGSASSPSITGWVMLALEAAGRNPLDVSKGGRTPVDYLRSTVGEIERSGDYARTILALEGAGVDTHSFAGHNLVSALVNRRAGNGSWEGWPGTTAYAVLALRAAGDSGGLDATLSWLSKVQNSDGGWGDERGKPSTPDNTGAVMQAMRSSKISQQGLAFLRGSQLSSGGFALGSSGPANSQSTAWAAQGMIAIGTDPGSISRGGNSVLDYLLARQDSDGHFKYSSSSDQTPVWVTAQALPAVAGKAFPVPPPPREPKPKPAPSTPEETSPGPVIPPSSFSPSTPSAPSPGGGAAPGPETGSGVPLPPTPPAATPGPPIPVPSTEGVEPETPAAPPFEATGRAPGTIPGRAARGRDRRRGSGRSAASSSSAAASAGRSRGAGDGRRDGDPHPPHPQGVRARAARPRGARGAARAGALGTEPQPDGPLAVPRCRAGVAGRAEGGRRPRGRRQARPGSDPGRRLRPARGRSGPGRGGPARDRGRLLHRPARRPCPRPRRLLADPGGAAQRGGAARGRARRWRALRRPPPSRVAAPGESAAAAPAGRPGDRS